MPSFTRTALYASVLLTFAGTASANDFEQVWTCEIQPGHSLDEIRSVAADWLSAARSMKGGVGLNVTIRWPIAVPDSSEQFEFVIRAPSLQDWGGFYDGYDPGSAVGKADEAFALVASCSGSTLWESISIPR